MREISNGQGKMKRRVNWGGLHSTGQETGEISDCPASAKASNVREALVVEMQLPFVVGGRPPSTAKPHFTLTSCSRTCSMVRVRCNDADS